MHQPAPAGAATAMAGRLPAWLGWLLVAPAAVALLVGYVWPTIRTGWLSLHGSEPPVMDPPMPPEMVAELWPSGFVGLDNYQQVAEAYDNPIGSFAFLLSLALLLLVVLLVVAPALAWAAHRAGRPARWTVRLALAVPMVCFVPVGLALGWQFERSAELDLDPSSTVRVAFWLATFGLVCGIGVTCYLAAFRAGRRTAPGQRRGSGVGGRWAAAATVAGLATLAVAAVVLQAFTYPVVIGGLRLGDIRVPMQVVYENWFYESRSGVSAAQAVLVLVPLMLLGLAAAVVVILTRLRVEVDDPPPPPEGGSGRAVALVGVGVGLAVVLAVAAYGVWPWLSQPGFGEARFPIRFGSTAEILVRTWLPPLVTTVVGVGLAAVAAFGIGALRPLGRWSELLLLPFAPWLFVGVGPLVAAKIEAASAEPFVRFGTFLGSVPPIGLVVPALFVLTLLFRGSASNAVRTAPDGAAPSYGRMLRAALPMVGLLAGATWLVQAQAPLWGSVAMLPPTPMSAPVLVMNRYFVTESGQPALGLLLPIPLLLVFAVTLGLLQVFYLDRLAIRVGRATSS